MKRFAEWKASTCIALGAVVGLAIGLLIVSSVAHTPCNGVDQWEPPPVCKHVLVVNPYTGLMETQYVCE